jgi:glycosyltransferase involved in cell wall biosynthesis
MISFIIIGYNEGWKLPKCIDSIYSSIKYNNIKSSEVIYVDSKSTDDSIDIAKKYPLDKVLKITGETNAAIARNAGALESKGDILFFIDGDMEIDPAFLGYVIDDDGNLMFDNVTGHLIDVFYDSEWDLMFERPRTYSSTIPQSNQELLTQGGVFVIKREAWEDVKGMRTKYTRNQDRDLSLRLREKGFKTIRIPHLIVRHHTIDYRNKTRMWKMFWSGKTLYPSVLIRDHFMNLEFLIREVRSLYTTLAFIIFLVSLLLPSPVWKCSLTIYLIILLIRVCANAKKAGTNKDKVLIQYFIERIFYQILRDVSFIIAFFLYYPKNKQVLYITC